MAGTFRERALGLVLTGCNTDGAIGIQTAKWMGGRGRGAGSIERPRGGDAARGYRDRVGDYVLPLERISATLTGMVMVSGVAEDARVAPSAA